MLVTNAFSVVVIGTGLAGYLFAKEFRKCDVHSVLTLITEDDGAFYSKPLLSTALTHQKTSAQLVIQSADTMRTQLNAMILTQSTVFRINSNQKIIFYRDADEQEKTLSYDQLILAMGAKKSAVPLQGDAAQDVLSVNNLTDYRQFREKLSGKKQVAIFGTGLVGCEFANDLANAGYSVTMISPDLYPLCALVPEAIGRALQVAFAQLNIEFHLSVAPTAVNKKNHRYDITLSDHQIATADLMFSAAGIKPDLSLAHSVGLKTNNGILVDDSYRTSDPYIFALGDCVEFHGELRLFIAAILHAAPLLAKKIAGHPVENKETVMSIIVKTPAYPIVIVKPKSRVRGEWRTAVDALDQKNVRALFYDTQHQLRGFALSGGCVSEKMQWVKQLVLQ